MTQISEQVSMREFARQCPEAASVWKRLRKQAGSSETVIELKYDVLSGEWFSSDQTISKKKWAEFANDLAVWIQAEFVETDDRTAFDVREDRITVKLYPGQNRVAVEVEVPVTVEKGESDCLEEGPDWKEMRAEMLRRGVLKLKFDVTGGYDEGSLQCVEVVAPDAKTKNWAIKTAEEFFFTHVRSGDGEPEFVGSWCNDFAAGVSWTDLSLRYTERETQRIEIQFED